ncbi:MAG: YncE family protein, partial [Gammaproteobacteria bacterium]
AVSRDDKTVFVTNQDDETLSVIDTLSFKTIKQIKVGDRSEGVAMLPNGKQIYVVNWGDDNLSVIDSRSLEVTGTIDTGQGCRAFGRFIVE